MYMVDSQDSPADSSQAIEEQSYAGLGDGYAEWEDLARVARNEVRSENDRLLEKFSLLRTDQHSRRSLESITRLLFSP